MIFYLSTDGLLAPTQALAGKGFSLVEIPTDKPGLMEHLNKLLIMIRGSALLPPEMEPVAVETAPGVTPAPITPKSLNRSDVEVMGYVVRSGPFNEPNLVNFIRANRDPEMLNALDKALIDARKAVLRG